MTNRTANVRVYIQSGHYIFPNEPNVCSESELFYVHSKAQISTAIKMGCAFSRANQQFRKRQAVKRLRKNILNVQKLKANTSPIRIPLRCPMVVMKEMGKELRRLYPDEKFGGISQTKNNIPHIDRKELRREWQDKQLMNQ